jgi:hypothetical protein
MLPESDYIPIIIGEIYDFFSKNYFDTARFLQIHTDVERLALKGYWFYADIYYSVISCLYTCCTRVLDTAFQLISFCSARRDTIFLKEAKFLPLYIY